jgi:hypothetical protein
LGLLIRLSKWRDWFRAHINNAKAKGR